MANRPNFLDLRSQSHGPFESSLSSPTSLPSPRLHIAGEIPPELSPLDAFAAQSRLLAKQLEDAARSGRRMSRLPPLTIASSLSQNKPGYFRSFSAEDAQGATPPDSPGFGQNPEVENPGVRPISVYPQVSGPPSTPAAAMPRLNAHDEERWRGRRPPSMATGQNHYGARRDQSPITLEKEYRISRTGVSPSHVQPRPSMESLRQRGNGSRRPQDGNMANGYGSRALAPPTSYSHRTPSPRSMSESSEDDYSHVNGVHGLSPNRKMSSSSGLSTSPTHISPGFHGHHMPRSPSMSSEISVGGTQLPRPAFNFSRPLSQTSIKSASGFPVDYPSRQPSSDSQPSFILADDSASTPVSIHSEGFFDNSENGPVPSYVYSKFSLPRGKMLQRNSLIFQTGQAYERNSWELPTSHINSQPIDGAAPPSPPSRPSTSSATETSKSALDAGRPSLESSRPSYDRGRPSTEHGPKSSRFSEDTSRMASSSASSSTVKARSFTSAADMNAEEHVAKGIEFHEAGSLTKSTYHLRLAARQHHPTGMLLYALACRHGWGMRPNQKEGVAWLRKAAESASLEVADDEDLEKGGKAVDLLEKKTRKAQFALSIYELGVSHMNGWGIEQDKGLALRCFEIAGSWGDADALAETGFCYAQGVGCKKDLKKSARFYRQAEAKGISMIGNSWIYKPKYNEDTNQNSRLSIEKEQQSPGKKEGKSKQRMIFGRMKSST